MFDVLDEAILFIYLFIYLFFLLYIHVLKQVLICFGCSEGCCHDILEHQKCFLDLKTSPDFLVT